MCTTNGDNVIFLFYAVSLPLHLTVDGHEIRLKTLETTFERLETKTDVMMEKLTKIESFFLHQAQSTPQRQSQPLTIPQLTDSVVTPTPTFKPVPGAKFD